MPADSTFCVKPLRPTLEAEPSAASLPLDRAERNAIKGLGETASGWLFLTLLMMAIGSWGAWFENKDPGLLGIGFAVVSSMAAMGGVMGLVDRAVKRDKIAAAERRKALRVSEQIANRNDSKIRRAAEEAASLSAALTNNYHASRSLADALPGHLESASGWLRRGAAEYEENAFSPFWDAVESATKELGAFQRNVNQLARNAGQYHQGLAGRDHTFPPFPVQPGHLPDASAVLGQFHAVVRLGQTNFQFANIWEHRRTRDVLIAGFRNLGDAISNLGGVVEDSLAELEQSVSDGTARVTREEIRTRETVEARLVEQTRLLETAHSARARSA